MVVVVFSSPFSSIISRHKTLEGLSQGSVEYQALQLVSSLEHYGVEWHWARDANGQRLAIGVGPEGIAICKEDFSLVNRYAPPRRKAVPILKMMVCFLFCSGYQEVFVLGTERLCFCTVFKISVYNGFFPFSC